jgi:hypothetical protein
MVDIILQIKTTLAAASQEAASLFGKGGYTQEQFDAWEKEGTLPNQLNYLGYVCTGISKDVKGNQYTTIRVDRAFLEPLKMVGETPNAKFLREYHEEGQEPFCIEVNAYDIDGNVVGTKMQQVAGIA